MRVTPVIADRTLVDGGANYGLVPKPLWSRLTPTDEQNRIAQNANCLLVELQDGRVGIVDTGAGAPAWHSDKFREIHAMGDDWPLLSALAHYQLAPEDLSFVVLSHLHWDHAGGIGRLGAEGEPQLTFPNAQHFVHALEWDDATSGDPVFGNAYPDAIWGALEAVRQNGLLLVTDAAPDILPGIRMARSGGHTRGHCAVILSDDSLTFRHPDAESLAGVDTVVFAGDLCPSQWHLRLLYLTSYDTHPLDTRGWKLEFLPEIASEGYLVAFCHDAGLAGALIAPGEKNDFVVKTPLAVVPTDP